MNTALILAGGVGSRMRLGDTPKQYLMVKNEPIINYCLKTFETHPQIDRIIIVAEMRWRGFLKEWLKKSHITKFYGFAETGSTRQLSIYSGLKEIAQFAAPDDLVIIHDAARPLVPPALITDCIRHNEQADGVMPVLAAKDTYYESADGRHITKLLKRSTLFAGQAPESFRFGKYYAVHNQMTEEALKRINGSSELAFLKGLTVEMIPGAEMNFKVTTQEDLQRLESCLEMLR